MKRKRQHFRKSKCENIAELVSSIESTGAAFRFTPGGSLVVVNLASVSAELRESFFNCDGRALVACVKSRERTPCFTAQRGKD